MSGETISPNMSLPIPGVGNTDGPDWATDINACLTLIDGHSHTAGSGVPITPDAININADLPFASFNATALRSARFTSQSAALALPSDLNCLSVVGVDLYYNDGSGNVVRITQSGSVAGSTGSISGLSSPASASYVAGSTKFVWQSAANTSALMDCGSIIMRNATASSNAMTINPPLAMGSNFSVTFPALPASTKIMTMDTSGNIGVSYGVDNSTLEVSSNVIQVKDLGITTAKLASGAVTAVKVAALNEQISLSSGNFSIPNSTTYADVTNLTVTVTSTGRAIDVRLVSDGSGNPGYIQNSTANIVKVAIVRDSTYVSEVLVGVTPTTSTTLVPITSIQHVDRVSAGTYVYKVQAAQTTASGGAAGSLRFAKLIAFEIL